MNNMESLFIDSYMKFVTTSRHSILVSSISSNENEEQSNSSTVVLWIIDLNKGNIESIPVIIKSFVVIEGL